MSLAERYWGEILSVVNDMTTAMSEIMKLYFIKQL